MEYLVKEFGGEVLGVTEYINDDPTDGIKVIWEDGVVSWPWLSRVLIHSRYDVIKELTDQEAKHMLLVWKLKNAKIR